MKAKATAWGIRPFDDTFEDDGEIYSCVSEEGVEKDFIEVFEEEDRARCESDYLDSWDGDKGQMYPLYEKRQIEKAIENALLHFTVDEQRALRTFTENLKEMFE